MAEDVEREEAYEVVVRRQFLSEPSNKNLEKAVSV